MKKIYLSIFFIYCNNLIATNPDWIYLSKSSLVYAFAEEANEIWIGHHGGLVRMDKTTGVKTYFDKTNSPLPDIWIKSIAIDNNGVKWFGTWGSGIVSYDDVNWNIYDTINTNLIYPVYINDIAVDSSNNIWVCTPYTYGGLIKFDGSVWTKFSTQNSGLPNDNVESVCADGNKIWASTQKGLASFNGVNWMVYDTSNSNYSMTIATDMKTDHSGNLWLLHGNSLEKFDGTSFTLYNTSNTNLPNTSMNSITIDTNNIIWTGCGSYLPNHLGGVVSFDGTSWTMYDTTNSPVSDIDASSIFVDQSNNIWAGYSRGMVDRKSGTTWQKFDPSSSLLNTPLVKNITFSPHGTYIGTQLNQLNNKGLSYFDWTTWANYDYYNTGTWSIATDNLGNLYVKNPNELKKFDGTNWSNIPNIPPLSPNVNGNMDLTCIAFDSSNGIWMDYLASVSTYWDTITMTTVYVIQEGLAHYDGTSWTTYTNSNSPLPNAPIYDIEVDHQNNVWIQTNGLFKFDGSNWTVYTSSNSTLPSNIFNSITLDSLDNVWLADSHYSLYKFDGSSCIYFQHPTMSQYTGGLKIVTDIDGSIWGTDFLRVFHFDGTNWTTFNSLNSPIPYFTNLTLLSIDKHGNKWIGTNNGLLVYRQGGVVTTSIPNIQDKKISTIIYPNPAHSNFTVQVHGYTSDLNLKIYNSLGKLVREEILHSGSTTFKRNALANGIYLYKVMSGDVQVASGKLVVN